MATAVPHGFVARNPADATSRRLPANPARDQLHGLVTFAFKVPLQVTAAADPFTVGILFLAADDDEVRITRSLEEQSPGQAAFEASGGRARREPDRGAAERARARSCGILMKALRERTRGAACSRGPGPRTAAGRPPDAWSTSSGR
ncbi:MAG TPA: hypothetical protein VF158_09250 [Longimicrobiales bacterium]